MAAPERQPVNPALLSSPEDKAQRASSFGAVADEYERFRPGPPVAAVEWFIPVHVDRIVDIGAGTGALTRLLLDRAGEVVAVEPDARMRDVLAARVPRARAVEGRGEAIPLPDSCADAVLASSSWHWMDPVPTLNEVARVLVPGGTLGAIWSGPDPDGPFFAQARALLAERVQGDGTGAGSARAEAGSPVSEIAGLISDAAIRPAYGLEIPSGLRFDEPERRAFTFDVSLNADELIGLLGTLSWVIMMTDDRRERLFAEARRLLREFLGVEAGVTVDIAFRADAWRCNYTG